MAYRSFGRSWQACHPPRYAAFLSPPSPNFGHSSGLRYRCKVCRRTFNALTKTPLAKLRMKDKWATQTEALIEGVSTAKAARRCGVHYTTAFRWRHRFLASLAGNKPKTLAGIVEGDET